MTAAHPWWNRTQGRDHFFVFAGARGPHIFKDWKKHIKKSIFLTPEGDRTLSEQFNTVGRGKSRLNNCLTQEALNPKP